MKIKIQKYNLENFRNFLKENHVKSMNDLARAFKKNKMIFETSDNFEKGSSLDTQVDRFLTQYEQEAKHLDDVVEMFDKRGRLIWEAEEDKSEDKQEEPDANSTPAKPGTEAIDLEMFANSLIRLIENFDTLLEIRSTIIRRAMKFLSSTYNEEVLSSLKDILRDEHGIEAGKNKFEIEDENFIAPAARGAGPE